MSARLRYALGIAALVALRLMHLGESTALPFLRGPIFDSEVYLAQARSLTAGRFGDATLVAFSPLYGALLALCGGGRGWLIPVVVQLALGVLTAIGLFALVRRQAGEGGAWLSAALFAGYSVPLFYETKLMSETLGLALALAAYALFLSSARAVGGVRRASAAGAVLGFAMLARASLIFTGPLFVVASLLPWERAQRLPAAARAARALAVAVGLSLVLGAHGLFNLAHAGQFVPVIMASRTAAVATQRGRSGGDGSDFRVYAREPGGDVSAWDVVAQAQRRLDGETAPEPSAPLAGIDLIGWLRAAPRKLAHSFGDVERSYDYGYYGERKELGLLGALPVSFGLIATLALLGALALVRREGPWSLVPHAPLIAGTLVTTTLYYATTRYRLPMVLPLLVLAGHLVPRAGELPRAWPRLVAALAAVLVFAGLTYTRHLERPALWELRVAESAAVAGDPDAMRARLDRARALAADAPDGPEVARRTRYILERAAHPAPLAAF